MFDGDPVRLAIGIIIYHLSNDKLTCFVIQVLALEMYKDVSHVVELFALLPGLHWLQ